MSRLFQTAGIKLPGLGSLKKHKDDSAHKASGTSSKDGKSFSSSLETKDYSIHGCLQMKFAKREELEIFTAKFSLDDQYVTIGLGDGRIQVYHSNTGELVHSLYEPTFSKTPCTNISFRPNDVAANRTPNTLVASYADGKVRHWHITSGKKLSEIDESLYGHGSAVPTTTQHREGEGNQTLSVDYFRDGTKYATAGSDCTVRIYDENTRQCTNAMFAGSTIAGTAGHSNRIFCVKFHPFDANVLVTSGWDNTVQMWDARSKSSIRSIYGPHICGESLDLDDTGERILTGAYDKKNPLQIWSFSTGSLMETIPWTVMDDKKPCLLYSASFSHSQPEEQSAANIRGGSSNKFIVAGGDISNEMKLFRTDSRKCSGMVTGMQNAVYTAAISHNEQKLAVAGGSKLLLMLDVDVEGSGQEITY